MPSGIPYWNFVVDISGNALRGVSVAVLTDAADLSTQPGSPLSPIFSDEALTQPLANPLTTDQFGRFQFYSGPGAFKVQVYGPGVSPSFVIPISLSNGTSGTVTWDSISSAVGNLSINNGNFTTSFFQTSPIAWLWANTQAATSGANRNSPSLTVQGAIWDGSVSQLDSWTLQVVEGSGSNPTSKLTISHNGVGSGVPSLSVGNLRFEAGVVDVSTGFRVAGAAALGAVLVGDGTNFVGAALSAASLSNGVTGSGLVVLQTSPTLITPVLGVASGTSVNLSAGIAIASLAPVGHVLQGNGTVFTDSSLFHPTTQTSAYNAVAFDYVRADTSGGGFTVTLPAAAANSGALVIVKKVSTDSNVLTIAAAANVEGAASVSVITPKTALAIISTGSTWEIV